MFELGKSVKFKIDNVIVQYHIFDKCQPIMVTFPPVCQSIPLALIDSDPTVWSFDFFAKRKMNIIAFNHIGSGNYFDSAEFISFLASIVDDLALFPQRIGYGASLGGFALTLHADRLKLSKALLMMPQTTYDKAIASWDPVVMKAQPSINNPMASLDGAHCETPLTVIYDPLWIPDKLHVARCIHPIQRLTIQGIGHRTPRALLHMGMLTDVVLAFIEGEIDKHDFYQRIKAKRNLSYYFRDAYKLPGLNLTKKRLFIIYKHKLIFRVNNLNFEPKKIATRLKESVDKRVNKLKHKP